MGLIERDRGIDNLRYPLHRPVPVFGLNRRKGGRGEEESTVGRSSRTVLRANFHGATFLGFKDVKVFHPWLKKRRTRLIHLDGSSIPTEMELFLFKIFFLFLFIRIIFGDKIRRSENIVGRKFRLVYEKSFTRVSFISNFVDPRRITGQFSVTNPWEGGARFSGCAFIVPARASGPGVCYLAEKSRTLETDIFSRSDIHPRRGEWLGSAFVKDPLTVAFCIYAPARDRPGRSGRARMQRQEIRS